MPDNMSSILSVLMNPKAMGDAQMLIDAMLTIQTQLSEIQENQRKIMKTLRDMKIEQRSRLSDLKKTTQVLMHDTHTALSDKLTELQDTVDEQLDDPLAHSELEIDMFK